MKSIILCEGTTDVLMIQFVLQYKYGWSYNGFEENKVSNRLVKRELKKNTHLVEIVSCGGIMNIPTQMQKIKDKMEFATRQEEFYDNIIIMIDHDSTESNELFLKKLNSKIETKIKENELGRNVEWTIKNDTLGKKIGIMLHIESIPQENTGAIESIMLEALSTDELESGLVDKCKKFINEVSHEQDRYLQKTSRIPKAVFNTYFAIRTPEEKYDERAKVLKAYDWENNQVLEQSFSFLNI